MKEYEITAETALQKITDIAKDAQRKQIQLTPTLILHITERALAEIRRGR